MAENKRQELEAKLESGLMSPSEFDARIDQLNLEESFELPEGDVRSDIFPIIARQDETAEGGKFLDIGTPGFIKDAVLRISDIVADIRSGKSPKPEKVAETAMDVVGTGFGASALTGIGSDIAGTALGSNVISAGGRFRKKSPETSFGIGDTVAPPVDRRSAKKVKDIEGNVAGFHGGMGAKVDDIYVGDDGKTKVVVRYTKDTDEIDPETNLPVFEEVTQTFDADQAEKAGLESLVKGKQPEIIPVKLAEPEDMEALDRVLTAEYQDPDDYSAVMQAIAGDLYERGKLENVKIGKRFKNQNGDIIQVTGVDADLAPYPANELAGKSDRIYFEVGVNKPVGVRIQYNNLTKGTQGSDIFDSFKNKKYQEITGELKEVESPKTGLMGDDTPEPVVGKLDVEEPEFQKLKSEWKERTGKGENKEVSRRFEEMTEAARKVQSGEMDVSEFRALADKIKPVTEWDFVPTPATYEDMFFALDAKKRNKPFLGYDIEMEDGVRTSSRLDIPAYTDNDVWVVTLKGGKDAADGQTVYAPAVRLKNVDLFQDEPKQRKSLKIAAGGGKGPHAVVSGDYVKESVEDTYKLAQEALNSEEWTQVGYDPTRRGYFYDRKTMEPVLSGDDMVQVGPLVLVKNAKKGNPEDFEFNEGGLLSPEFTEMRQGGGIETEAGKEMAKEKFQLDRDKADLNNDGKLSEYEKTRGEAVQRAMGEGKENKMAAGGGVAAMAGYPSGMMADPFAPLQVTIGIDEHSGNEVPAGSKDEEVRDDIPAMLSEGEYVVPADVVRWHGLKTFEGLRCEAKHALGLMAMHDRISFVDEDTKEPVEYDIEEKEKPEVEEAEVKVIKAQEGTDVQPAPSTTFYQLRYITDPVTGRTRMAYVDPLTGQEVTREEYEEERATRFAPQRVLEREVYSPTEDVAEEEEPEEEKAEPIVPLPVDEGGDGRDEEDAFGPGRYGMSEEGFTLEDDTQVRSTDAIYSRIDPSFSKYTQAVDTGALGVAFPGLSMIANLANKVGKEYKEYQIAKDIRSGDYLGITPSTPDYGDWRNNMSEDLAASVAESELEARDVVSKDRDLSGSSFGSRAEAEAVAEHGAFSDEHFDAIESGFSKTDQFGLGDEGTDEGDAADTSGANASGPEGTDLGDVGTSPGSGQGEEPEDQDSGPGGFGLFNKGGMPVRKNTPRKAMITYNKGRK